jgi:hypothetical protein
MVRVCILPPQIRFKFLNFERNGSNQEIDMGLDITPTSPLNSGVSNDSNRQAYLGALTSALRNGNVVAAQQALLGLSGIAGGLSPAAVFNTIESALNSGKVEEMKAASSLLDASRASKPTHKDSISPSSSDLMPASGTGKLVNIKV